MKIKINKFFTFGFLFLLLLFELFPATQSDKTPSSFLWEIQKDNQKSYIIGSIHLMKKEIYPLKEKIENAFNEAEVLVLEMDLSGDNMNELSIQTLEKGLLPDNKELKDVLSAATYDKVNKILKERFNMDISMFKKYKPWFLAMLIESRELIDIGYLPQYGIDFYFLSKAKDKKKIWGLETIDFQLNLLDQFGALDQEKFLLYTLTEIDKSKKMVDKIVEFWQNGNTQEMEKLIYDDIKQNPDFLPIEKKLLTERNFKMVEKIDEFWRQQKKMFIVTGAAHLLGKKGIIHLLQEKGFQLNQL